MNKTAQDSIRVLIAISNVAVGGGAEKVSVTIANEFLKQGINTKLLTFYTSEVEHNFQGERFSIHEATPASVLGKLPRAFHRIWRIKQVCKKNDIDTVISFLEESNYYALLSKLLLFNRTRMIVSVRNDPRQYNRLYKLLIRVLYPFAEKVVAVTKGVEQSLREDFSLKNTTTIYNPIDQEIINVKSEEELPESFQWIAERSPLFVTVGRLARQKGQWHLIRAFKKAVTQKPNATLLIIGEGPYKGNLDALISELELTNNVFLLGRQENVYPFFKNADVFVLSSLWEGMPNALLEAAATGCKIVATDASTGVREILAPELALTQKITYPYTATHGTLVTPFDPQDDITASSDMHIAQEEQLNFALLHSLQGSGTNNTFNEDKRFDRQTILEKWKRLL